jgi:hypothetical protein
MRKLSLLATLFAVVAPLFLGTASVTLAHHWIL